MSRKAAGPADDAAAGSEDLGIQVSEAAPNLLARRTHTFEGAYAEYFSTVCLGQHAHRAELQRMYGEYLTAMRAAMATLDGDAALRAQRTFEREWVRLSDPSRLQEGVRDAFAAYQQNVSHAFAAADLTRLAPGELEAISRGVWHVATHRIWAGA